MRDWLVTTLSSVMQFSIRHLLCWTMLAAVVLTMFQYMEPLLAAILCVPVVTVYFSVVRLTERQSNDTLALVGAGIGFVVGIAFGNLTDIGLVFLNYRPNLPPQDFKILFGATISAIALSFVGAIVGGIANRVLKRRIGHPR